MHPKDLVINTFQQHFGRKPRHLAVAPGRVNILGEHVDYNDGLVLPAAIDLATTIAFSPANSGGAKSTLIAADLNEKISFSPASTRTKTSAQGNPLPEWALYPAGMAWALNEAGFTAAPIDAVYASDIPIGAGLSSSASVEMAFAVAWSALGDWKLPPMELALLGQRAENSYVGVNSGIMDQFASACGAANKLLLLDCRSLEWHSVPIPDSIAIVIADTTVRRKLTSSAYNQRRQACEEAVKTLSKHLPGIKALRDVSLNEFNQLSKHLPRLVEKRARHVIEEIGRVGCALPLLEQGNIGGFGQIMNACHASLRDLYEVSIDELNTMAEIAQNLPGCYGARLTGAGFGGCTVNLVEKDAAQAFAAELAGRYQALTGLQPEIHICCASDGARLL